jgi:hypothetical protein
MEPREIYVIRRMSTNEFLRPDASPTPFFGPDVLRASVFDDRDSAEAWARRAALRIVPGQAERLEIVRIRIEERQAWLVPSPTHEKTK